MNIRAVLAAAGVLLISSAAIVAFNGMRAVSVMDAFASEWAGRLRVSSQGAAAAPPTEPEIFESLNGHIGHRLSRLIVWSLAVQGLAGIVLLVTSYKMRTTPARAEADGAG